jgi:hypothetical protein
MKSIITSLLKLRTNLRQHRISSHCYLLPPLSLYHNFLDSRSIATIYKALGFDLNVSHNAFNKIANWQYKPAPKMARKLRKTALAPLVTIDPKGNITQQFIAEVSNILRYPFSGRGQFEWPFALAVYGTAFPYTCGVIRELMSEESLRLHTALESSLSPEERFRYLYSSPSIANFIDSEKLHSCQLRASNPIASLQSADLERYVLSLTLYLLAAIDVDNSQRSSSTTRANDIFGPLLSSATENNISLHEAYWRAVKHSSVSIDNEADNWHAFARILSKQLGGDRDDWSRSLNRYRNGETVKASLLANILTHSFEQTSAVRDYWFLYYSIRLIINFMKKLSALSEDEKSSLLQEYPKHYQHHLERLQKEDVGATTPTPSDQSPN